MIRSPLTTGLALAVLAATIFAAPQSAGAAMHHRKRMHVAKRVKLIPASAKPGYRSMVGTPSLIDPVPVTPNGGLLGLGILPSTGVFKGVPVVGEFGL